ncbi:MAG: hypothetical protein Q8R18_05860 [bacterium]|nr:hypothetical protein [bacterium]
MNLVEVSIEGAKTKALSRQCKECDFFEFDAETATKVLQEIKEQPIQIKQKIVKLSKDRLGIYFNKHIVESLKLDAGEEISITIPDKKHIWISLKK